jgi:tryptophan synthase alpha chain
MSVSSRIPSRIMAHMVAFYPDRRASFGVARGLAEGGAAYIELQFPFSDPTADGPDIQRACSAALEAGFTVEAGFALASEISRVVEVPLFIMSYANLLFTRGVKRFLTDARACGARGVIVPDLPPDYDEGLFKTAAELSLAAVPVLSPSMRDTRLSRVGELGAEFLYVTLRTGTTGSFTEIDSPGLSFLSRVARMDHGRQVKILGGFGVSTREQVEAFSPHVHAVVVGSALVRVVAAGGDIGEGVRQKVLALRGAEGGSAA